MTLAIFRNQIYQLNLDETMSLWKTDSSPIPIPYGDFDLLIDPTDEDLELVSPPSEAYLRGVSDGYSVGVYDQQLHDVFREASPTGGSEYKTGYDRGVAMYCDENNLGGE